MRYNLRSVTILLDCVRSAEGMDHPDGYLTVRSCGLQGVRIARVSYDAGGAKNYTFLTDVISHKVAAGWLADAGRVANAKLPSKLARVEG